MTSKNVKNNKQIKSKQRVKKFAEVFTAEREVKAMCDLIPVEMYSDLTKTWLEPTCGNGNFLVEILKRKMQYCKTPEDYLTALNSLFGIDIQKDNVIETKQRLFNMVKDKTDKDKAFEILNNNIIVGDFLKESQKWIDLESEE